WDSYTTDTCNNLASKTANAAKEETASDADEIIIYPNPSNGNFNIGYNNAEAPYSIEIVSFSGQKVFEKQNINNPEIGVSHLAKGIYIVVITKDEK
ncbi:T9SS C-terminal target domain-containing protein, partial [Flavobacterium circumlabens]